MKHLADRFFVYLRLYACYIKLNYFRALAYRADFLIGLVINTFGALILFYFYDTVFEKIEMLGTWDKARAMLLVGSYIIVESAYIAFAFHSISELPKLIVHGELDSYLLRPISTTALLILREIDFGSLISGIFGVGLIVAYSSAISVWQIVHFIFAVTLGFIFLSLVLLLLMSLAFWWGRVDEFRDLLSWTMELGSKPAAVYPPVIRNLLYWIFPIFLMANVPAEILAGERYGALLFLPVIIALYLLHTAIWSLGLKKYQSGSH
ncbi:MAG: hypothetical protein C5B47_02425 [Verrucomicrobia bacterium]|nr:MAG: hypothetical protein C5B47_02425 [Verrucomicrobiota bacterium]